MGTFSVPIEVGNLDGTRWERFDALVDTGSSVTSIPHRVWEALGLTTRSRRRFALADGRETEYDLADALVRIDGQEAVTLVLSGEDDSMPLLAPYSLEGLFLAPDPVNKRLIQVPGWRV